MVPSGVAVESSAAFTCQATPSGPPYQASQQRQQEKHQEDEEQEFCNACSRHGDAGKTKVSPRAAAFALLGMINWIYQWYKPEGELQAQNLIPQFTELVFGGFFA